jgi:hypothetical protein
MLGWFSAAMACASFSKRSLKRSADFYSDISMQAGVGGAIHFAHAARSDPRNDLKRTETRSHGK